MVHLRQRNTANFLKSPTSLRPTWCGSYAIDSHGLNVERNSSLITLIFMVGISTFISNQGSVFTRAFKVYFTLGYLNRIKSYHIIFKDLLISSVKWQEKQSRSSGRPSRDVMNFTRHFVSTVSRRVVFYSPMVCTVSVEVSSSESNNSNFPVVNIGLRSRFFLVPNHS